MTNQEIKTETPDLSAQTENLGKGAMRSIQTLFIQNGMSFSEGKSLSFDEKGNKISGDQKTEGVKYTFTSNENIISCRVTKDGEEVSNLTLREDGKVSLRANNQEISTREILASSSNVNLGKPAETDLLQIGDACRVINNIIIDIGVNSLKQAKPSIKDSGTADKRDADDVLKKL